MRTDLYGIGSKNKYPPERKSNLKIVLSCAKDEVRHDPKAMIKKLILFMMKVYFTFI